MRRDKHHIGRLRIQAAKILARHFPDWDVRPEDIVPATGRWRSDWRQDVYRLELFARTRNGIPVVCGSLETLTNFVASAGKYGCVCAKGEIWANTKPTRLIDILAD